MKKHRVLLFVAGLAALIVGYIELRLPMPVVAQGRDAVFGRLAVTGGARIADDLSIGNALTFGTALTPAMTAKLAAAGTASMLTYLRGDGQWAGVSPPTYFSIVTSSFNNTSLSTWADTGLEVSVSATATDTVVVDLQFLSLKNCLVRVTGGSSTLQGYQPRLDFSTSYKDISLTLVDTPGAGTHNYKVQLRTFTASGVGQDYSCRFRHAATFIAQVLQ